MIAMISPRVDAASKLAPNGILAGTSGSFALAEGLTTNEAAELAAWLKNAGYASIEIVNGAEQCSVRWNKGNAGNEAKQL